MSQSTVLFCGAGFSAQFGLPTMNAFLGVVDTSRRLDAGERDFIGNLVLAARRANSFLESSPTNLEDILSFAVMSERLQMSVAGEARPSDRLCTILRKIYANVADFHGYWAAFDRISEFLGQRPRDLQSSLSFITTNYDLNIECALLRHGCPCTLGFTPDRVAEEGRAVDRLYQDEGIPLCKLHGSVNWFRNADGSLKIDDAIVHAAGRNVGDTVRLPRVSTLNYVAPGQPVIIPPSFLKPDLPPELREVWRRAAELLRRATTVVFVGYSFPRTDTEMHYFLATALSENPGLRSVLIVDIAATSLCARLTESTSRFGSHFKALLEPLNGSWGACRLKLRLPAPE